MAYITRKASKEKESNNDKNSFSARTPQIYVSIFIFAGWFLLIIFLAFYFYNGIVFNDYDLVWIYTGGAIVSVVFLIWLVASLWRLDIDGTEVYYCTFWGHKKRISFAEIDKVVKTNQRSLIIYSKHKRFGTVNSDFIGYDIFLERCEDEQIEVTTKDRTTLTKFRIFMHSMMGMIVLAGIIAFVLLLVLLFVPMEIEYSVLEIILLLLFIFFGLIGMSSLLPLGGLLKIMRQEQALNFSFAEEMRQYDVKSSYFTNEQLFIDSGTTHIVAFRRDYIKSVGNSEACYADKSQQCQAIVNTIEGPIKVKSSNDTLISLQRWFEN
jgi:hypothetical protein